MPEKIYLIDGHSYTYQAYYAIRNLNAPDGTPVNAVYGFTNLLMRILMREKPQYLAVAFDTTQETFRKKSYADYKAQRAPMPEDLVVQMPIIREVIEALGVPILEQPGYEADDVLGTVASMAAGRKIESYLISKDKDLKQLLGDHVFLLDVVADAKYDVSSLRRELSITPEQVTDYLGLSGDSSDNIPGVPGVGPKTAAELLSRYGTLEEVLANADKIEKPRLRANLIEYADQARLSKKLATLHVTVPLGIDMEDLSRPDLVAERVLPIFHRLGFRKFAAMIEEGGGGAARVEYAAAGADGAPQVDYKLVNDEKGLEDLVKTLSRERILAVDTETTSRTAMLAELVGVSFCYAPHRAYYVAVRGPVGAKTLPPGRTLAALKGVLENADIKKVGQNIKYDALVLRNSGINLSPLHFDTMIASYLLKSDSRGHGLDELALAELGHRMTPISDLIGKGKKQTTMDLVPIEEVCRYSCEDADVAMRIYRIYEKRIAEEGLADLFYGVEMPLVGVLVGMEYYGIRLDTALLARMENSLAGKIKELEDEIYLLAGEPFNVSSPRQLAEILFEKRRLSPIRKTKSGYSTDAEVLEALAVIDPLPAAVLEYRRLTKLKSTYVDTLPTLINPRTGRIHASFNQAVAATGRLSSSDPNLQNIPVRTELGRQIRAAFTASEPGRVLITADYSQIELRILAHLSHDPALVAAFREGRDIHTEVACRVFGLEPEELKKEHRTLAKAVNFGILYGQSPFGLSRELKIPQTEARAFIERYFETYSGVKGFIGELIESARRSGYVTTILNRRRSIPEIASRNKQERALAERMAVNTVIQGSAADLIKVAMNRIDERVRAGKSRAAILLQIHDELLFEVPRTDVERETAVIEEAMTGAMDLIVPLVVTVAVGDNWMEVG